MISVKLENLVSRFALGPHLDCPPPTRYLIDNRAFGFLFIGGFASLHAGIELLGA
jgi:hypothetical protein